MDVLLELLAEVPSAAALLTSGYIDQRALVGSARKHGIDFIQKPYALNELYAAVGSALDSGGLVLPS